MHHEPNPARPTQRCKIKRVYRAFRSVSTPRRAKDLHVVGPVDPEKPLGSTERQDPPSERSAKAFTERRRIELASRGWTRLVRPAAACGNGVTQLLSARSAERA
jgi:hypothetical protein